MTAKQIKDRILTFQFDRWRIWGGNKEQPKDVNDKSLLIVTWDDIESYTKERAVGFWLFLDKQRIHGKDLSEKTRVEWYDKFINAK